jgi:hypothetical protein
LSTPPPSQQQQNQSPQARQSPPQTASQLISEQITIVPGVFIPDLKKGDNAWLDAIQQWENGDESKGLKPLRDWPREWYCDGMRKVTGTKRSQRKLIFDEYERFPSLCLDDY